MSIKWCYFQWPLMIHNSGFKVTILFIGEYVKTFNAFNSMHLHCPAADIYLVNLECTVTLTRGPSAIAECLVSLSDVMYMRGNCSRQVSMCPSVCLNTSKNI